MARQPAWPDIVVPECGKKWGAQKPLISMLECRKAGALKLMFTGRRSKSVHGRPDPAPSTRPQYAGTSAGLRVALTVHFRVSFGLQRVTFAEIATPNRAHSE